MIPFSTAITTSCHQYFGGLAEEKQQRLHYSFQLPQRICIIKTPTELLPWSSEKGYSKTGMLQLGLEKGNSKK